MTFELTADGLSTETQQEAIDKIVAKIRATFGNNTDTAVETIMGQLINIFAEFDAFSQQVVLAVYRSFDANSAIGVALDRIAGLTGTVRKGATNSTVEGELTFSGPGTTNNGDLIQNDDLQTQWQLVNGPISDTGGPYPEVVQGAVYQAVDTGPLLANAGTVWSLVTTPAGLAGFANPTEDAERGRDIESDPELRARRIIERFSGNLGGLLAISGVVSKVDGVSFVRTYHNPATNPVDADGIPFKAFNVVVESEGVMTPELSQTISDAIFSAIGAGGEAFGTDENNSVTDSEGQVQPDIRFDIVDLVDVYITIDFSTTGSEQELSDNVEQVIADAILENAETCFNGVGRDQLEIEYVGVVTDLLKRGEITGVGTVVAKLSVVSNAGPFLSPSLPIEIRERPDFSSARIEVNQI